MGSVAAAALFADGYPGRAKIVMDPNQRVLLGATFVGRCAVPADPTISEVWLRLLQTYGLRPEYCRAP